MELRKSWRTKNHLWALGCYYVMVKLDPHSKTQHTSPVGTISGALLGQTDNGLLLSQELTVKGEKREIRQLSMCTAVNQGGPIQLVPDLGEEGQQVAGRGPQFWVVGTVRAPAWH